MQEEIKEAIDMVKDEIERSPKLCKTCIFSNDECTWCMENKIPIKSKMMVGCRKHMTDNQAMIKIAEEEQKSHQHDLSRILLKMDIMAYLVNGASIVLEEVDRELEHSYDAVKNKDDDTIRNHAERKRNRGRLEKAYKSMRFSLQDIRNTFTRYVEYYFNTIFSDKNGYDWKESDKNLVNSGVMASFAKIFIDRSLENGENATKIINYMMSLQGSGILDESDFGRSMIRK